MAKRNRNGTKLIFEGRALPVRLTKHIARLGFGEPKHYFAWCLENGFSNLTRKSWEELEREWCVQSRAIARAQAREQIDRDPAKLLELVFSGKRCPEDIARPRWRRLAERFQQAQLTASEHRAFETLVEAATRRGNLLIAEVRFGNEVHSVLEGLIELARAHSNWQRHPRGWRPRSHNAKRQFASLARHLLARYAVPGFLDSAWCRSDANADRYRDWYIAIGTGHSIRNEIGPIVMTRKIAHYLQAAPDSHSIEQAIRWAQIQALGGDRALANAVCASPIGESFRNDDFWITVLRFFVANPALERSHFGPVVDFLEAKRYATREEFTRPGVLEVLGPPQPNLSMQGRTPQSLLRAVDAWHRELGREGISAPNKQWVSSGIGALEFAVGVEEKNKRVWRIRELLSTAELRREGARMRHCVATYARSCASQRCSIWAMELHAFKKIEKRQTVEVNSDGVIVQCRGRFNRLPKEHELGILRRWAAQEGLQVGNSIGQR